MRRMVAFSSLLILVGLLLLLPSSDLWSLLTTGQVSSGSLSSFGTTTNNTTTIESLIGFGLIGIGLVLEILSLFTQSSTIQVPDSRRAVKG